MSQIIVTGDRSRLPAPSPYNWSGCYVGINAGGGSRGSNFTASAGAGTHLADHLRGERRPRKTVGTVLVIDHDPQIRRFMTAGLELYGCSVAEAEGGTAGLNTATVLRPDLIILDPALSDMNGADVLKTIRSWSDVPVIILSVRSDEEHKVRFLRGGADDYLTKPFGIAELAARCEAVLRRCHRGVDKNPVVQTGPLTINLVTREVTLDGRHVTLARQEYRLLRLLASHLGLVITHNQLIQDIWGDDSAENVRYLRTLVRKLRQKLEPDPSEPKLLMSEPGVGYRLERNPVVAVAIAGVAGRPS